MTITKVRRSLRQPQDFHNKGERKKYSFHPSALKLPRRACTKKYTLKVVSDIQENKKNIGNDNY